MVIFYGIFYALVVNILNFMEIHHIHGTEVGFHGGTEKAIDFLKNGISGDTARGYMRHAENNGEAHFYDSNGTKYTIKHELSDGNKSNFSVKVSDY